MGAVLNHDKILEIIYSKFAKLKCVNEDNQLNRVVAFDDDYYYWTNGNAALMVACSDVRSLELNAGKTFFKNNIHYEKVYPAVRKKFNELKFDNSFVKMDAKFGVVHNPINYFKSGQHLKIKDYYYYIPIIQLIFLMHKVIGENFNLEFYIVDKVVLYAEITTEKNEKLACFLIAPDRVIEEQ